MLHPMPHDLCHCSRVTASSLMWLGLDSLGKPHALKGLKAGHCDGKEWGDKHHPGAEASERKEEERDEHSVIFNELPR